MSKKHKKQQYGGYYSPYGGDYYGGGTSYDYDYYDRQRQVDRSYQRVERTYVETDYYAKYSRASSYTYTKPDYKKIKEKLLEKQKILNKVGFPAKIGYGTFSLYRRNGGLVKLSCLMVDAVDKAKKFVDKLEGLGIGDIDEVGSKICEELIRGSDASISSINTDWYNSAREEMIKKMEQQDKKRDKKQKKAAQQGRGGRGGEKISKVDEMKAKIITEELLSKIKVKESIFSKEDSVRKGTRISRKYINKQSYKPLVRNIVEKRNRKKILAIIDGSGSMMEGPGGTSTLSNSYLLQASNFMYGLRDTMIYNMDGIFSQGQTAVKIDEQGEEYNIYHNDGSEGFEAIEHRTSDLLGSISHDYIFVFTDCNIGSDQLSALENLINKGKHIIFNFGGQVLGDNVRGMYSLNVKDVKTTRDMVQTLINYI